MVDWRKLEAAVDRKIGGTFGERVRLSFMKNGKSDPDRQQMIVRCEALCVGGDEVSTLGGARSGQFQTRLASGEAELFLDRASYDGPPLQSGDSVRALDRSGEPLWEVANVSTRDTSMIAIRLREK